MGIEPSALWSQTRCANQTALRPVYTSAIGKFVGKVIGSKVVQGAAKVAKKVTHAAVEGVKAVGRGIARTAGAVWGGVKSIGSGIASFFGF
ncbi:hypothetical protein [Campylobacter hyointestinalis]|uniref:hypothetical protein n=1 Tax=Campylobacter hyointestinalis TaxID=198 RepID=UPI000DCB06B4|nr:hypothetical protein [Campylobacter hyointestinalis]RAZ46670.1 hypothetical protein CHL14416_03815 [Campylobacter hyointestinalis subsp. lawsonii]